MCITPAGEALRPAFDTISRRFVRILYAGVDCKEAEKLDAATAAPTAWRRAERGRLR